MPEEAQEAQGTEETPQEATQDAGLSESLERIEGTMRESLDRINERLDERDQYQPEPAQEEPAYGFEQDEYGIGLAPEVQQYAEQQVREAIRTEVEPRFQEIAEKERVEGIYDLEDQFPDLKEKEVADKVWAEAVEEAAALGNPELARQPAFLKRIYLSRKAEAHAAQEREQASRTEQEVPVEGEGGGSPGAPAGADLAAEIVAAQSKRVGTIWDS